MQACRRSARTIFLGSAPSVGGQQVRGIGVERVRLGSVQPGQSPSKIDDALRRLSDRLHYLYTGNERYWYDLRPNLRREMEDRMQRYEERLHLYPELQARLRKQLRLHSVDAVSVFEKSSDLRDDRDLKLVVLEPSTPHKLRSADSRAVQAATALLERHGERPREFRNRLLFLAADVSSVDTLRDSVRRYLAWRSIVEDANELNLDKHHERESRKALDEANARLDAGIRECYRLLLVPMQDAEAAATGSAAQWEDESLPVSGHGYERALEKVLHEQEWVIREWAPAHLVALCRSWFWTASARWASAKRVWLDTCRYLYLPRLRSEKHFELSLREGLQSGQLGYASVYAEGRAEGLLFGRDGAVHLDEHSVLLEAELAAELARPTPEPGAQPPAQDAVPEAGTPPSAAPGGFARRPSTGGRVGAPPSAPRRRFHGTVKLDPRDPIGSFTAVVEGLVEKFTGDFRTEVVLTLDVEAERSAGFEGSTLMSVSENARTLGFVVAEFEEE
jgi:hypothetical protein